MNIAAAWSSFAGLTRPQKQFLAEHWTVGGPVSDIVEVAGVPGEQAFAAVYYEAGAWEWVVMRHSGEIFLEGHDGTKDAAKSTALESLGLLV
jgi:hypothetical protein